MKTLDKKGACIQYLYEIFPSLSNKKFKAGIFDGSQKRNTVNDQQFGNSMMTIDKDAWFSSVAVTKNVLENNKAANYVNLVENMLKAFQNLKCNIRIKVHFLFSQLNKFPENLDHVSDK